MSGWQLPPELVDAPFGHPAIDSAVYAGWHELLADLHVKLEAIDPGHRVDQFKEKFGTLRVYVVASAPEFVDGLRAAVDLAEAAVGGHMRVLQRARHPPVPSGRAAGARRRATGTRPGVQATERARQRVQPSLIPRRGCSSIAMESSRRYRRETRRNASASASRQGTSRSIARSGVMHFHEQIRDSVRQLGHAFDIVWSSSWYEKIVAARRQAARVSPLALGPRAHLQSHTRVHYKAEAVRVFLDQNPRPFAWVDDDLRPGRPNRAVAELPLRYVPIRPNRVSA